MSKPAKESEPVEKSPATAADASPPDPKYPFGDFGGVPETDTLQILQHLEELKAKAAQADELREKHLRAVADLDNFKKRAARDLQDGAKFANQALLERLVPVLDNFEAALLAANSGQKTSVESLKTGITMIHAQLRGVLSEAGLEEIDATNQTFNPNLHEAVSEQETTEVPEGRVVQQLRRGYKLRDRLVRPATVVVAKKPAA